VTRVFGYVPVLVRSVSGVAVQASPFHAQAITNIPLVSWWGCSIGAAVHLHSGRSDAQLGQSLDSCAEFAALRARALAHEAQAEEDRAALCWTELAHNFSFKKSRHDAAIVHARRALDLKESPSLREELAQWLEGIGSWSEAAELLADMSEPKGGLERARWYRRLASLRWRAGELEQAAHALAEVARIDAECTEPLELLAGLHSNAPLVVSRERAVLAQLEAARRHQQRGARLAAFEAELRAVEIDPSSILATEQLANSLTKLGRREAADDIWRICAKLNADRSLHHLQIDKALGRDEFDRALGAGLDALSDRALSVGSAVQAAEFSIQPYGATPKTFDGLLARTRLFGWLAARLEMAVIESRSRDQSKAWTLLTRLFASAMGRPELAVQSLTRALVVEPTSPELRRMLDAFADDAKSNISRTTMVDALRVGVSSEVRTRLAGEFIEHVTEEAAPMGLVAWAFEVLGQASVPSILQSSMTDWQARKVAQQEEWSSMLNSVDSLVSAEEKVRVLQWVGSAMALDPGALIAERDVLLGWLRLEPESPRALDRLAQLTEVFSWRQSDDSLDQSWDHALGLLCNSPGDTGVITVTSHWLRQGRAEQALHILRQALARPEPSQRFLGWVVTLARRMADTRLYAEGLCLMAKGIEPSIAAMLFAHAAESYLELGDADGARRAVDGGLALAPTLARLVGADVRLQEGKEPRALAETLERALGVIPPRAQFASQLADAHQKLGNSELALSWAQRASTLQPAEVPLRNRVAVLAIAAGDSARMAEWLLRSIDVPAQIGIWLPQAIEVLEALIRVEAPRAAEVVRRLIASTGSADAKWRTALLAAADAVSDTRLALDILERGVASGSDVALALHEIVRRRLQLGDFESAYEAALRAIQLGVPREQVRDWVAALFETESYPVADTELAAAELAWELTRHSTDTDTITRAMRRLAKDRLLLSRDEPAAFEMWSALLGLQHTDILSTVANDLVPNLGHAALIRWLLEWGVAATDRKRQAAFCVATAYLYAQSGDVTQSRVFVERALAYDATNVDALLIAESQTQQESDCDWLDEIYGIADNALFGQHGSRALHYRAAKVFESKGRPSRALRHACDAFVAVPSAGVVFRLLASLTRAVGDAQSFVDSIWTIASSCSSSQGARWISQAIEELEQTESFLSARFELLLRALTLDSSVFVVQKAAEVTQLLLESSPGDGEMASLRLTKALRSKLDAANGPQGARLSLVMANTAISLLDFELCAQSLRCAFRCDADVDEYSEVEPAVQRLGTNPSVANRLLSEVLEDLDQPYINVGFGALRVLGLLQLAGGDAATLHRLNALVMRLGQREPFLAWLGGVLEHSAQETSGSGAVLHELVQIRLQEDRLGDALQLLSSIIKGNPRTVLAQESARQGVSLLTKQRDLAAAGHWVQSIRESLSPVDIATLELELARQLGEGLPLVHALAHRAYSDPNSPVEGMAYLQEATALADRLGYIEEACEVAKSAVAWDPNHVGAQLQLATLLYKLRDHEGDDHAEEIVSALRKLPPQSRAEDEEMRAFLLAEALDSTYGTGTGTDELVRAHGRVGDRPLIALGIAERLVLAGDNTAALPLFDHAIAGDLRGLRQLALVCLEAARLARSEGQLSLALRWLQRAATETNCPVAAKELVSELTQELQSRPIERTATTASAHNLAVHNLAGESHTASGAMRSAPNADDSEEDSLEIPLVRRRTDKPPSTPRPVGHPPTTASAVIESDNEPQTLDQALAQARFMIERASPSYQTLTVLRRWLRRWPGSARLMEYVRDAAFVERDIPLSRAVEHARGVLLGLTERIEPPELCAQPIVPEAVKLLLARELATPVGDAIAMLLEGAEHLVQRDLLEYGVTGLDRVVPNAANVLWQVACDLTPRLDLLKVPLFHQKSAEPIVARVALANPTSVVFQGELPRNVRALAGLLGASLWITQPEYSLLMGAPAEQVKAVLLALQLAFGPPQKHALTNMSEALRLAEKLWECIPSSAQRHLRELCLDNLDYGVAYEHAKCAQRRAGLYATGDLHWALAGLSREEGHDVLAKLADPQLSDRFPRVADLLRLATSAEYAAVRWQPSRGSELRADVTQR